MLNQNSLIQAITDFNALNEHQIEQFYKPINFKVSKHKLFKQAVDLINLSIQKNHKIIICGDYDADGICSTTILYRTLKKLNANVGYYIPNRFKEGYGLNDNTVR